jgi:GGDEF domain-containing protein
VACFARHLREAAPPADRLARWSDTRFALAVPVGGRAAAEAVVDRLSSAWAHEPTPPFAVGIALTVPAHPASKAISAAESALENALSVTGPAARPAPEAGAASAPASGPGPGSGPRIGPGGGAGGGAGAVPARGGYAAMAIR